MKTAIVLGALLAAALPAAAYHRQTPPILPITNSGDTLLPRVPAGGRRLALSLDTSGEQIFRQDRRINVLQQITTAGDNRNPTISQNGSLIAWDSDCSVIGCADPGRQVFLWMGGHIVQVTQDPTGTSVNPALAARGTRLVFESSGDLATVANGGVTQVFVRTLDGTITQLTQGNGPSRNAALSRSGATVVYESTNDGNGADTGIVQIWMLAPHHGAPTAITAGTAPSRLPAISPDGHLIAFESTADLTGDGLDTGVSQIFLYRTTTQTLTQLTNDASGCTGASVGPFASDWHVGYVCHEQGFFHQVLTNRSYRLPIDGGDTVQAVAELGRYFFMVSTTANLLGGGTTPGHQLYLLNLFKLAAIPVP